MKKCDNLGAWPEHAYMSMNCVLVINRKQEDQVALNHSPELYIGIC